MGKLACFLFGHKGPDNTVTAFREGVYYTYQCPRCYEVLRLKQYAGRLWIAGKERP